MVSDDFILGMIAGEGSFHIVLEPPNDNHIGRERPKFCMTMYEDSILRDMCIDLGLGVVQHDGGDRSTWHVQSRSEVEKLRNWVDGAITDDFKRTDKYEQFQLWSEAIDLLPEPRQPVPKTIRKRLVELSYEIPRSDTKNRSKQEWFELIESTGVHYCGEPTQDDTPCTNRVPSKDETCRWHS